MEIGKPKRKFTIEPIKDPIRREREADRPAAAPEPARRVTVPQR